MTPSRERLQIRYVGGGWWRVVVLDAAEVVIEESPPAQDEAEAELYVKNYRRFGAWKKS